MVSSPTYKIIGLIQRLIGHMIIVYFIKKYGLKCSSSLLRNTIEFIFTSIVTYICNVDV